MWTHFCQRAPIPATIAMLLIACPIHASEPEDVRAGCPFTAIRAPILLVQVFAKRAPCGGGALAWRGHYDSPEELLTLVGPVDHLAPSDGFAFVVYDVKDVEEAPARVGIKPVPVFPWTDQIGSVRLELDYTEGCGLVLVISDAAGGRARIRITLATSGAEELVEYEDEDSPFAKLRVRATLLGFVARDALAFDKWDSSSW